MARLLLALVGILFAVAVSEAALRVAHFHFDLVPTLEFGWPDPVTLRDAYASDPDLIWVTRDYRERLRNARRLHPALVFMGDSCTEFGSYPARTLASLEAAGSPLSRGVQLGVAGWSIAQGLAQLRRDVARMHPKIVTVYYGWNDHWTAYGLTDPEIMQAHAVRTLAEYLRLAQMWLKLEVAYKGKRTPAPNRVPVDAYAEYIEQLTREAHASHIEAVFITAPDNHVPGHEPPYLAKRHLRSLSELVPLHTAYVEATREHARHAGARVCDAASAFAALPQPHDRYFQRDGIHLTSSGDEVMASVVSACLRQIQ